MHQPSNGAMLLVAIGTLIGFISQGFLVVACINLFKSARANRNASGTWVNPFTLGTRTADLSPQAADYLRRMRKGLLTYLALLFIAAGFAIGGVYWAQT